MDSILTRLPGAGKVPGSDNGAMRRGAFAAIRSAELVYVGVRMFTGRWPGTADGLAEIAALVLAGIILALWALAESSPAARGRIDRWLPWGFGAIAATSGAVTILPGGSDFIVLSVIAVVAAAIRASRAAGWIVWAVGAAATAAVTLARGGDDWLPSATPPRCWWVSSRG